MHRRTDQTQRISPRLGGAGGGAAAPPRDIAGLCDLLGDIPGTDPPRLIAALSPDPQTAEQTLRDLITQAQQLAAAPPAADHS